ncbi:MAG: hypothetical protein NTX50_01720 [Candidatus Sumerlaeota bacterium]|nr:hypothetical protein [Candidatus Sumerlaeota bacterium]
MIGGIDIIIPVEGLYARNAIDVALRAIRVKWRTAVYENPDHEGEYFSIWKLDIPYSDEIFVYKSQEYAQRWGTMGYDDSLKNTMIHVIEEEKTLTMVVDNAEEQEISSILKCIRMGLTRGAVIQGEMAV